MKNSSELNKIENILCIMKNNFCSCLVGSCRGGGVSLRYVPRTGFSTFNFTFEKRKTMYEDHTITRKINLMRMFMLMREIRFNITAITAYMVFATKLCYLV